MDAESEKFTTEKLCWEAERLRMKREYQVLEDKYNDTVRDLSVSEETKRNAIKRYNKAIAYNLEVERITEQLRRSFDVERGEMMGKLSEMKGELGGLKEELGFKLREKDAEVDDMRKKCDGFKAESERLEEELGFKLREKDAEIDDMRKKCDELEVESERLKEELGFKSREKDVRIDDLAKKCAELEVVVRGKDEQIAELNRRKDGDLDEQVKKRIEVLRTQLLEITEIRSKKNRRIEELEKEKAGLERENSKITETFKIVEERVVELEEDVVTHLCVKAKRDEKFRGSVIGKIMYEIANTLDEVGVTINGEVMTEGNSEEDPAVASPAKATKCYVKSEKVTETIVHSEDEHSEKNCTQKSQAPVLIQISDSEDEDVSCDANDRKRARASPTNQKQGDDSSSDDRLSPKIKIKKLEQVISESPKHEQPIAASEKKTMPIIIRRCKESLNRKMQAEGSEGSCISSSRRKESDILKYLGKCQQIEGNFVFECEGDMIVACKNDPVLCAKAVRALHKKGLLCSGKGGFKKCDIVRGAAQAVYLVYCVPNTMSADELKQRDPEALDVCEKLVSEYSHELFQIFKSNEDPLFSHMSISKQHK